MWRIYGVLGLTCFNTSCKKYFCAFLVLSLKLLSNPTSPMAETLWFLIKSKNCLTCGSVHLATFFRMHPYSHFPLCISGHADGLSFRVTIYQNASFQIERWTFQLFRYDGCDSQTISRVSNLLPMRSIFFKILSSVLESDDIGWCCTVVIPLSEFANSSSIARISFLSWSKSLVVSNLYLL